MPLFHYLWTDNGTGNANFFYATTLVFACSNGAALIDSTWAGLRIAIGDMKNGHDATKLVEKVGKDNVTGEQRDTANDSEDEGVEWVVVQE